MKLKDFAKSMEEQRVLALRLQVHPVYLWQVAHRWHDVRPSGKLAAGIVRETGGQVTYSDLFDPWPEDPAKTPAADAPPPPSATRVGASN